MLVYCPSDWPCRLADFTIAAQPLSTVKQYEETRALTIGCVTSIANSKRGHIQKVSRGQSILWTSGQGRRKKMRPEILEDHRPHWMLTGGRGCCRAVFHQPTYHNDEENRVNGWWRWAARSVKAPRTLHDFFIPEFKGQNYLTYLPNNTIIPATNSEIGGAAVVLRFIRRHILAVLDHSRSQQGLRPAPVTVCVSGQTVPRSEFRGAFR